MSVAGILKPATSRDDFRCIRATEDFARYIKPDAAFLRRFQVLPLMAEPAPDRTLAIYTEWSPTNRAASGVTVEDEAVRAAVELSTRLLRIGRATPDKLSTPGECGGLRQGVVAVGPR